jgi:hypothetical protein
MGIRLTSSLWIGIYRCIRKNAGRGWFVILMICRYGEIFVVVGILVIFPGNAYCWCIKVSKPPLGLLYGCPWVRRVWVGVIVLLNIILYCGNILYKYLVDLDAVSLVSWMAIIDGGVDLFIISCKPGSMVLSMPQFHFNIFVAGFRVRGVLRVYGWVILCRIGVREVW